MSQVGAQNGSYCPGNERCAVETTLEQQVQMVQYQWPLGSGGCDCHNKRNVADLEVAFDSHAYAD
jgi:hypothetical protein